MEERFGLDSQGSAQGSYGVSSDPRGGEVGKYYNKLCKLYARLVYKYCIGARTLPHRSKK